MKNTAALLAHLHLLQSTPPEKIRTHLARLEQPARQRWNEAERLRAARTMRANRRNGGWRSGA